MTRGNSIRLVFGLLIVLGTLYGLLLVLDNSMTHIASRTAQLRADSYTVGTDYSGIIIKQYVAVGDHVTIGQPLFVAKSSLLDAAIGNGSVRGSDVAFTLDSKNQIILKATNPGVVSNINYLEGAFVPASSVIATVTRDQSLYVEAQYSLSPPDYARINRGDLLRITLPNNDRVAATIFDIHVDTFNGSVETTILARIAPDNYTDNFAAGTPVSAELHLSGKSVYDGTKEVLQRLMKPRG